MGLDMCRDDVPRKLTSTLSNEAISCIIAISAPCKSTCMCRELSLSMEELVVEEAMALHLVHQ